MNTNLSSQVAVEAKNLSKIYPLIKNALFFKRLFSRTTKGFCALDKITFQVKRGSCFGILGLNGSGKSTLLQLLAGITQPTDGEVKVNGRLSAIFELGSGFNLDFTGRENIALYASVVGLNDYLTKEIEAEILNFAEIDDFIDQPLSTYSTGMIARLGFAVRAFLDFDILVLDEVLAVGDMYFQRKCMRLLEKFKNEGKTIIFVSHNINQVLELCDKAMVLDKGALSFFGSPKRCAYHYYEMLNMMRDQSLEPEENTVTVNEFKPNYGKGRCSLKFFNYSGQKIERGFVLPSLEDAEFNFLVDVHEDVEDLEFGLNIRTREGTVISGRRFRLGNCSKNDELNVRVSFKNMLNAGHYFLSCGLTSSHKRKRIFEARYLDFLDISVPEIDYKYDIKHTGSFILFDEIHLTTSPRS